MGIDTQATANLSRKIGLTAATASVIIGILYLAGLGVNLATSGSAAPSGSDVRAVSAVLALLWNLSLVALFVALRREADPARAPLAELALAFMIIVGALSSARWMLGLTGYASAMKDYPELAAMLDPYSPTSIPYALEHLGWGLFFGIAAILGGVATQGEGGSGWAGRLLVIAGLLSLAHFLGVLAASAFLVGMGYVSWGVFLPLASAFLVGMFRRKLKLHGS